MGEQNPTNPITDTQTQTQPQVTDQPKVETKPEVKQPSLEEIISLISKAGNETLMQLAPIQDLVQSARKQEKDKLYKSLEQKEKEAKDFKEKLEAASDALQKYESDSLSFEEKMELKLKEVQDAHDLLVKQLTADKEQAEKEANAKALEAYKAEKLRVAGDELILELVGGNTKEEIDASIETAKAKYQEIASKFASQKKAEQVKDVKETFTASAPSSQGVKTLTQEDVNRMSPEEYAKNRPLILEMIRRGELQ